MVFASSLTEPILVSNMEEKYALEKQMKEKELQQQQLDAEQQVRLERQKIISIAVGAGLILALALAFVLLKRNEEKRRSNMVGNKVYLTTVMIDGDVQNIVWR